MTLRSLGLALLLTLTAVPVWIAAAPPAAACSCIEWSLAEEAAAYDDVFVVDLADKVDSDSVEIRMRGAVTHVYQGEPPDEVTVTARNSGSSCGLPQLRRGGSWLILGPWRGRYTASLCSNGRPVTAALTEELERTFGPGRARPVVETTVAPPAVEGERDVRPAAEPATDDGHTPVAVGVAVGAAVAAAGGALLWRRRRRTQS